MKKTFSLFFADVGRLWVRQKFLHRGVKFHFCNQVASDEGNDTPVISKVKTDSKSTEIVYQFIYIGLSLNQSLFVHHHLIDLYSSKSDEEKQTLIFFFCWAAPW